MKGRIFVGGLHHESDTFNPIITGRDDIWVTRAADLLIKCQNSVSGIIQTLIAAGYEVVPSLVARAVPNGVWDRSYYEELKEELLTDLKNAGELDALCLSLHGSMRVEGIGEAEQDLLTSIRELKPTIPLFTSLDMHATLTRRMKNLASGFVGYKCAPHTDTYETGIHAALMTIRTLESKKKPTMAAVRIPMLLAGEQSETSVEPMKTLISELRTHEQQKGVLACSYLLGFPWADGTENGVHALVVTQEDQDLAEEIAQSLADLFWEKRNEFKFYNETHLPEKALEAAKESLSNNIYPVVISDSGDNPTAGSSGDVTNFLHLLLNDPVLSQLDPPLIYQGFYDPNIVEEAEAAGVGAVIESRIGSFFDPAKSSPVTGSFTVKALYDSWENNTRLALLSIGGIDVVAMSKHAGCYDPEMMRVLGVSVEERKVIVVKLGYLEPEIRSIAKRSMMALTTGSSDELFERLEYKNLPRPIFPLDGEFEANLELI